MSRILFGLLLVFAALIQATILPLLNPFAVFPNFVLVFLFMWSASHSVRESLSWVFVAGILLDVLALDSLGVNALALVIVVFLAGLARQRVLHANILIPIALVALSTVVHGVVLAVLRGDSPVGWFIPLQALVHALLIPVFYLAQRVFGR